MMGYLMLGARVFCPGPGLFFRIGSYFAAKMALTEDFKSDEDLTRFFYFK